MSVAVRINDFLIGLFAGAGIRLVDFKLEFGRVWEVTCNVLFWPMKSVRIIAACGTQTAMKSLIKTGSDKTLAGWLMPIRKLPAGWVFFRQTGMTVKRAGARKLRQA